jgi:hypothetical protein
MRYSPLQSSGRGNQGVYLTEVSQVFAEVLAGLIGVEAQTLIGTNYVEVPMQTGDDLDEWEQRIERQIDANLSIPTTEKESIIRARRGQGLFKERVMEVEAGCRITGVTDAVHLIGSHIVPWRDSSNDERLDGENGLLLTPSVDHLFDRGFIGFQGNGVLIISPVARQPSLDRMGIPTNHQVNVGSFTAKQKHFLEYHRDKVLLKAVRADG